MSKASWGQPGLVLCHQLLLGPLPVLLNKTHSQWMTAPPYSGLWATGCRLDKWVLAENDLTLCLFSVNIYLVFCLGSLSWNGSCKVKASPLSINLFFPFITSGRVITQSGGKKSKLLHNLWNFSVFSELCMNMSGVEFNCYSRHGSCESMADCSISRFFGHRYEGLVNGLNL